jgi:hypothetical protein
MKPTCVGAAARVSARQLRRLCVAPVTSSSERYACLYFAALTTEPTLQMVPFRAAIMCGATAWIMRSTPHTLAADVRQAGRTARVLQLSSQEHVAEVQELGWIGGGGSAHRMRERHPAAISAGHAESDVKRLALTLVYILRLGHIHLARRMDNEGRMREERCGRWCGRMRESQAPIAGILQPYANARGHSRAPPHGLYGRGWLPVA